MPQHPNQLVQVAVSGICLPEPAAPSSIALERSDDADKRLQHACQTHVSAQMLASKKIPKKSDKNGKGMSGCEKDGEGRGGEWGSTFTINPAVALPVAVVLAATAAGGTASLLLVVATSRLRSLAQLTAACCC